MLHRTVNTAVEYWTTRKTVCTDAGGVVASQHRLASLAGARELAAGGNAIDAAIATALTLGVVEPWMCGLGGSGLAVVWLAREGRAVWLDFQGVLGRAADSANYPVDAARGPTLMGFPTVIDAANDQGPRSITVPGAAMAFDRLLNGFGSRSRQDVSADAIAFAHAGIDVDWYTTLQIALAYPLLAADSVSRQIYLPEGVPLPPESRLHIPGLADSLESFAADGAEGFYRGALGRRIADDFATRGVPLDGEDLDGYTLHESTAERFVHRGHTLLGGGDASGGTRMRAVLQACEYAIESRGTSPSSDDWIVIADALADAWTEHRRRFAADVEQDGCTSHLSTVDAEGNMVALTHTLLNRFGSGVTLPSTGLLMNNAVSYFDPRPGRPTSIHPGARIASSNMSPTIVLDRDGHAVLSLGASGGNHIMPAVTQVIALMLDAGLSFEAAMHHPRIDISTGDSVQADPALGDAVLQALARARTVNAEQRLVYPKLYACVSAVAHDPSNGQCLGLTDPSLPTACAVGPGTVDRAATPGIASGFAERSTDASATPRPVRA